MIKKAVNIIRQEGVKHFLIKSCLFLESRLQIPIFVLSRIYSSIAGRNTQIWIFSDFGSPSFSQNQKYFFLYLSNNIEKARPIWITTDEKLYCEMNEEGYEVYMRTSLRAAYYTLRAKYTLSSGGRGYHWALSGGATKIQAGHGIPLKGSNGASDTRQNSLLEKIGWNDVDYAVFSSAYCRKHFQQYYPEDAFLFRSLPTGTALYTGYPRTDALFQQIDGQQIDMPGESLQDVISEEELVIGYFPTHRNREYEIKIENILRLDELNGILESKNAKMVIKPHRSLDMISVQEDYENIKEIPQSTDSHVFLDKIDILITDYSSIYFDFLLVGGPVIFYTHDRDQYTKMRGLHPKYDEVTIGHHTKEPDELVEILDQLIIGKDTYTNERKEIRDEFFKYNDRQSSKRLYKSITTDQLD